MALDPVPPVAPAGVWSDAELRTHEAALRAAARYICRDDGEREDLIQDTFERGLRFLSAGNPRPTNMRVWLVSILRNAFIDRRRRARGAVVFEELDDRTDRAPPIEAEPPPVWAEVSIDEVRAALGRLEPGLRKAFELHYLDRLRYREISDQLGIPANTVATRLFRARKALREVLLRERGAK
jgi:RNA polymerase sigma-70 factor, ECF subfamily